MQKIALVGCLIGAKRGMLVREISLLSHFFPTR